MHLLCRFPKCVMERNAPDCKIMCWVAPLMYVCVCVYLHIYIYILEYMCIYL